MTETEPHGATASMVIVAVANQKGGVGKTTVAMQVGAELSRRHRVLVVDVDRQQSTVWWAENARDRLPFDFAGSQRPNMLSRLGDLRADYEFVLVDTPGSLEDTAVLETVLDAADYALVPVTPEPLAVDPTLRTLSRLIEPRHLRRTRRRGVRIGPRGGPRTDMTFPNAIGACIARLLPHGWGTSGSMVLVDRHYSLVPSATAANAARTRVAPTS